MALLAKDLAMRIGAKYEPVLRRENASVQVGADNEMRKMQAKRAYSVRGGIEADREYLLVDDVWTTGSSMLAACEKIFHAGARKISVAIIAKSV